MAVETEVDLAALELLMASDVVVEGGKEVEAEEELSGSMLVDDSVDVLDGPSELLIEVEDETGRTIREIVEVVRTLLEVELSMLDDSTLFVDRTLLDDRALLVHTTPLDELSFFTASTTFAPQTPFLIAMPMMPFK